MPRWLLPVLLVFASSCGDELDKDNDDVGDDVDNCVDTPNTDQRNQDGDFAGDACDCINDNAAADLPNTDLDDSDRLLSLFGCDPDEIMTGIFTEPQSDDTDLVDAIGIICTKRCDATMSREFGGEGIAQDFQGTCPAGNVIVGIAYKDRPGEDFMDGATVLCVPEDNLDATPVTAPNPDLDANPDPFVTVACPPGDEPSGIGEKDSRSDMLGSDFADAMTVICREGRW